MSVKNNVPKIRFRGFRGGWLNNLIGDICGVTFGGGTPATSEKSFWQGDIPWIQSSDLKDGNISSVTAKKHITKAAINKSATKLVAGHSIAIVTRVGVGKLSLMEGEYATSQDFLSLSDLKIDARYSAYAIWKQLQNDKEQVQGTSIKGITKEELLSKTISHPKLKPEQTKIGNLFQKLDTLINQHQQKHDKLSNIKKAMLEKMFPKQGETIPEIRFKGFSGEWEEIKFKEMAEIKRGLTYKPSDIVDMGVVVLRSSNINIDKFELRKDDIQVDKKAVNINFINNGDILITSANGSSQLVGKHAVINSLNIDSVHGGFMLAATTNDPYFLNASMNTYWYNRFLTMNISGGNGAIGNIKGSVLEEELLYVPKKDERDKIGYYFQKLDALIDQNQQQITKLNNIKQACLSKMFV